MVWQGRYVIASALPRPFHQTPLLTRPCVNLAYNKWHETELERWLSDHNIPYPTPADRKDLENLVKDNWNSKIVQPYNEWDTARLQSYLGQKGYDLKQGAADSRDSLVETVKSYWGETEDQATDAYSKVRDWIFDRYVRVASTTLLTC